MQVQAVKSVSSRRVPVLVKALLSMVVAVLSTACGQKGPLTLPPVNTSPAAGPAPAAPGAASAPAR